MPPRSKQLDLSGALASVWLLDPHRGRPYVLRALSVPCPSGLSVARERRRRLDWMRDTAAHTVKGPGVTGPEERRLGADGGQIVATRGRIGTVPIYGPIGQRLSTEVLKCGGTACEEIAACLDSLLADKSVEAIVLDVDSPGGSSYGVEELADKIYEARGVKPIYAIANSMACSAAYWLASAAGQMLATPGGDVGSVGCYMMHVDQSGYDELQGLAITFVSAGTYKVEANPHEPLGTEAAAYLQTQVDYTAGRFLAALARNRGVSTAQVEAGFGQGRVFNAEQALAAGMIDRILSFDELLRKLTGGGPEAPVQVRRTMPAAAAEASGRQELRRRRLEHERRKAQVLAGYGKRLEDEPPAAAPEPKEEEDQAPGLHHDSQTSAQEPPFEDVDQDRLPDQAFADPESRQYCHHWVEAGGDEDEEGKFTSGQMYLHREGLRVATHEAETDGADDVQDHLAEHRQALGMEDEEPETEADAHGEGETEEQADDRK